MSGPIKALTIRQPWAWAIFNAGKYVENRSRPTKHRGPLAIHVSRRFVTGEILDSAACMRTTMGPSDIEMTVAMLKNQLGCIIGIVDVVDCVCDSASPWAIPGQWHWVLRNPRRVRPVPIVGRLGLFDYTAELEMIP